MMIPRLDNVDAMTGQPLPSGVLAPDRSEMVKSGARVLEILEFFFREERPARAFEIAEALDMPNSSTVGLLRTLTESGYLTFNSRTKAYFPSFRIVRLGEWISKSYFGRSRILVLMEELRKDLGECVALTVQNGIFMQFVAVLPAPGIKNAFQEGFKTSIVGSAAGNALLMSLGTRQGMDLLLQATRNHPARSKECQEIMARVDRFRRQGYATGARQHVKGTRTVAVPFPANATCVPMVLGVGGPVSRIEHRELEIAVAITNGISRCLM